LGPYKRAVLEATKRAGAIKRADDGMVLFEFPNYESYRNVQVTGNKAKLRMQFSVTYEKLLTMLKTDFDTAGSLIETIDTRIKNIARLLSSSKRGSKSPYPESPINA
jgi:hypothetical protein